MGETGAPNPAWVIVPVPIREGMTVQLQLPRDLTAEEAAKIGRVVAALARSRLARKKRGSSNYRKQRLRVARLTSRVAAARKDFLHKTSTTIAKNHGLVVLENLKVRNMTASARGTAERPGRKVRQKAGLNRAILDSSSSFRAAALKVSGG